MTDTPVVLFAYARPDYLTKTLSSLRENHIPRLIVFSDGPRSEADRPRVDSVREILNNIDWADIQITERRDNLGLGRSILAGVSEVLKTHDRIIVFEDDLVCVPGTYQYLARALDEYAYDERVMSVTGWTHPAITPRNVRDLPYFDGRAECWVWGTWARAWEGMEETAKSMMEQCRALGIDVARYGDDLVQMAEAEIELNIWAVRFLYLHILRGGLCVRPPWSMVDHIGVDPRATNAAYATWLSQPSLKPSPQVPARWPVPREFPECARLHRAFIGGNPAHPVVTAFRGVKRILRGMNRG
jgi:hypothetical protein